MLSLGLYFLAFSLASLFFIFLFSIQILFLYGFFLVIYSPKSIQYSYETRGAAAVSQSFALLVASMSQSFNILLGSISQLLSMLLQNFSSVYYYILISLILFIPSLVWLEYHPEIISLMHSAYQCVILPFTSFLNLFTNLIVLGYNIIWPLWAGFAEIARFFLRELPISILFCTVFSLEDLFNKVGEFIVALLVDINNIFISSSDPLSNGVVDFTLSFSRLGQLVYYLLYNVTNCTCSSGNVLWNFLFSWLFDTNGGGYSVLQPPSLANKKRVTLNTQQTNPKSLFGNLISSATSVIIEIPQFVIRTVTGKNGPIVFNSNITFIVHSNYSMLTGSGAGYGETEYTLYILLNTIESIPLNYSSLNQNDLEPYLTNTNNTNNFTQYYFPQDSAMGYYPNIKILGDKIKLLFMNTGSLIDYQLHVIYIVFLYVFKGFNAQAITQAEIDAYPYDNGTTKFIFRIGCLFIDIIEFGWNLVMAFISGKAYSCDTRDVRAVFDLGGSSTLFYQMESILNTTNIARYDNNAASKARLFGTAFVLVKDIERVVAYIHPDFAGFVSGTLWAALSLLSGAYNSVWRTIAHIVDDEYRMYPANNGLPPNSGKGVYPLSDDFQPSDFLYPGNIILSPSECNDIVYSTIVPSFAKRNGLFFVWLQDNYKEMSGVHVTLLYGLYKNWISIESAIAIGSTTAGTWIFSLFYNVNALWDSLYQTIIYINVILAESTLQKSLFISQWKYDKFTVQLDYFGKNTSSIIRLGDPSNTNCAGLNTYDTLNSGFICGLAYTIDSIFAIFDGINKQVILCVTSTLVPPFKVPDFSYSINQTEYAARNLTVIVANVIPPIVVNSDGTTLNTVIAVPLKSFVSIFFIFLTVPNYLIKIIATEIINRPPFTTPQSVFTSFVTIIGSLLQFIGDEIIERVGMRFLVDIGGLFDRLFNSDTLFQDLVSSLILIIDVIRNAFTEFAIKLVALLFNVLGTFIAVFFDTTKSMSTKLSDFFGALGDFILFILVQAPLFLIDFIIGLLDVILPPPLNIIVTTILRLLLIGLCNVIQFFITTVASIINFFGGSITPVNLCCNGGCTKKRDGVDDQNQTKDITIETDMSFVNDIINSVVNAPSSKDHTRDRDKTLEESLSKGSYSGMKLRNKLDRFEKAMNNIKQSKSHNSHPGHQAQKRNTLYEYCSIKTERYIDSNRILTKDKCIDYYHSIDDCVLCDNDGWNATLIGASSNYISKRAFFSNLNDTLTLPSSDTTNTSQENVYVTMDEALTLVMEIVDWNGTTSCDIFMRDFVSKNRSVSDLTILEDIHLRDCISKRSVGEIISVFPQFRWVPADILYDPFSIVKLVFDGVKAYKSYAQYQRDKSVPRSIFLSQSYKEMWQSYGLNTTYMTEDNYDNVIQNYTAYDYFNMNNANPDFVDALGDGFDMFAGKSDVIWNSIYNLSVDYKDSSIKYMDAIIEQRINQLSAQNISDTEKITLQEQLRTMNLWKAVLSSLQSTSQELQKRGVMEKGFNAIKGVENLTKRIKQFQLKMYNMTNAGTIVDTSYSFLKYYFSNIPSQHYSKIMNNNNVSSSSSSSTSLKRKLSALSYHQNANDTLLYDCEVRYIEFIFELNTTTRTNQNGDSDDNEFIDLCVNEKIRHNDNKFVYIRTGLSYSYNQIKKSLRSNPLVHNFLQGFKQNVIKKMEHITNTQSTNAPIFISLFSKGIELRQSYQHYMINNSSTILNKRNVENVNDTYPCVPEIFGYCTNCIIVDSSFSMFYEIGQRLVANYTQSSPSIPNNASSYITRTISLYNDRVKCLYLQEQYANSSCGCPSLITSFPVFAGQPSPLSFPSGINLLPGDNGEGTFFSLFKGNALSSFSSYFDNVNLFQSTTEGLYSLLNGQFVQKGNIRIKTNMSTILFSQSLTQSQSQSTSSSSSSSRYTSYFEMSRYPTLYKTISMNGRIPLNVLKTNPLSGCELYVLMYGGRSLTIDGSMCELYGWPDFTSSTTLKVSQNLYVIMNKTNLPASFIINQNEDGFTASNTNIVMSLSSYISRLYVFSVDQYMSSMTLFTNETQSTNTTQYKISTVTGLSYPDSNRILSYYNSGSVDMTYLIFYIINVAKLGELVDFVATQLSSLLGEFSDIIGALDQSNDQNQQSSSNSMNTMTHPLFIYHPGIILNNLTLNSFISNYVNTSAPVTSNTIYDNIKTSSLSSVSYINDEEDQNFVGIQNTLGVVYETVIMANFNYECSVYRRTDLLSGVITVTLVYIFLSIFISLVSSSIGLTSFTSLIIIGLFTLTWLPVLLIYTYSYPLLNLFPVMLLPPCFADDIYSLITCDILPKCPKIFYPFVVNQNYTLDNCQQCPSTLSFAHCKYDYGFYDIVDSGMFLIKWFIPSFYDSLFSVSGDALSPSSGLSSIISSIFPFSYLYSSAYFKRKTDLFGTLDMNNVRTFDAYTMCFTATLFSFVPASLLIVTTFVSIGTAVFFSLFTLFAFIYTLVNSYILWINALFTHVSYNYLYTVTPIDMINVDKVLTKELERRFQKQQQKTNANGNENEPENEGGEVIGMNEQQNENESENDEENNTLSSANRKRKNQRRRLKRGEKKVLNLLQKYGVTEDNVQFMKRKPLLCYQNSWIGYIYDKIWWYQYKNMSHTKHYTQHNYKNDFLTQRSLNNEGRAERFFVRYFPNTLYKMWKLFNVAQKTKFRTNKLIHVNENYENEEKNALMNKRTKKSDDDPNENFEKNMFMMDDMTEKKSFVGLDDKVRHRRKTTLRKSN